MTSPRDGARLVLCKVGAGTLSLGPRPSASTLVEWARTLQAGQVDKVLSLIETTEIELFRLSDEPFVLAGSGIVHQHFPIADFGVPEPNGFGSLIGSLSHDLAAGRSLHLHCAGGVGRAGLAACCLLVFNGRTPGEAIRLISEKRGVSVPETDAQKRFIETFARHGRRTGRAPLG